MNTKSLLMLLVIAGIAVSGCDQGGVKSGAPYEALVSKGFVDDNTWKVVCRGYPLEGLKGIQKSESSKRAALLGAYHYIQETFNESVEPDRDGKTEKIEVMGDHVVLYYVVRKRGLKKMLKAEKKPDTKTENRPEEKTENTIETKTE